ncbi:MAG: GAF domain-containing protein [Chloroflexota bacterium]|nr:GAF domain-containing protein [Chloroflexota bacterium]
MSDDMMRHKRLLSVGEASRYLGVSRTTLLKAEDQGLIRPVRTPGGHRRYGTEELDRLLQHSVAVFERGYGYRASPETSLPTFINQIASNPSSLEEVAYQSISLLADSFQADIGAVFALDGNESLGLLASYGVPVEAANSWANNAITNKVMRDGLPLGYEDLNVDLSGVSGPFQAVCVPMVYRGVPLGVFHLVSTRRYQFYPSEVNILKMVAVYLASLIVDSDRLRQNHRHIEELTFIERISRDMQVETDLGSSLEKFLAGTIEVLEADAGAVFLRDPSRGGYYVYAVRGCPCPEKMWDFRVESGEGITGWVLERGKTRFSLNLPGDPRLLPGARDLVKGMASSICLPLKIEGEVIGAFHIASYKPRHFEPGEERFLTTIAGQAALIINRAHLYQQMADLAKREAILRKHYAEILEEMPIAIKVVDKDLRILTFNKAMEGLTGLRREEALGQIEFDALPVLRTSPEAMECFDTLLQTGEIVEKHNLLITGFREEGVKTTYNVKLLPLKDDKGDLEGAVLFIKDITQLVTMQRMLEDAGLTLAV